MKGTLKTRAEFQRVYEKGHKAVGHHVVIFALSTEDETGPQFPATNQHRSTTAVGVVASRKVGNAIARNRAKRVLRAAYHPLRERLQGGIQLVLVARRSILTDAAGSRQLNQELEQLLERLEILAPPDRPAPGEELS